MGSTSSKPHSTAKPASKHRNRGYYDYNQHYLPGYWPAGTEAAYGYPRPGVVPTYAAAVPPLPQYPVYYPAHVPAPVVMPEPQPYVPPQPPAVRPVIPTVARPPIQPEQAAANPRVIQPVIPPVSPQEQPKKRKPPRKKTPIAVITFGSPNNKEHARRSSQSSANRTSPQQARFTSRSERPPTTSPTRSFHDRRDSTSAAGEHPHNPLPKVPVDIFTTTPYKHLLEELTMWPPPSLESKKPITVQQEPEIQDLPLPPKKGRFGLGKKNPPPPPLSQTKLAYVPPTSRKAPASAIFTNAPASPMSAGTTYTGKGASIPAPPAGGDCSCSSSSGSGNGNGGPPSPCPSSPPPPIYFNQDTEFAGFLNHSPHSVSYERVTYPTATHLIEAMKYLPETAHNHGVAQLIRACADLADVYRLSYEHRDKQHVEHGESYMEKMGRVMYLKFNQHGSLADLLLSTGEAPLVYDDPSDSFWGVGGANGEPGQNELGYMLEDIRARLRHERKR